MIWLQRCGPNLASGSVASFQGTISVFSRVAFPEKAGMQHEDNSFFPRQIAFGMFSPTGIV
jgi:hypothetical protein